MLLIVFTTVRDGTLEGKTSCFTLSDGSDRYKTSITRHNQVISNKLEQKVTDN